MFLTPESIKSFFERWVKKQNKSNGEDAPKDSPVAVLIIDMQKVFLEDIDGKERRRLIESQAEILNYCAEHDIPIVVVEYRGCGKTIRELKRRIKKVPRQEFVTKNVNNGFRNPELEEALKTWGVKKIILMGVNASACVIETAEGAIKKGFQIATSECLIADEGKTDKSLPWYKKNSIYKENHLELIRTLNTI